MARMLRALNDLSPDELNQVFDKIKTLKGQIKKRKTINVLKNRVVGLFFEKPSTRTRVSFEAATLRLGGGSISLPSSELQLKRGETIKDTARIIGGYLDIVVARVYSHQTIEALCRYSGIPVINALSDRGHPTQVISDLFTVMETKGRLRGLTLAYIGDGNNVCHSLLLGCALTGMNMKAGCPKEYQPDQTVLREACAIAEKTGAVINVVEDPVDAATGADIVYTDVWVSMGDEAEKEARLKAFQGYQINDQLLRVAAHDAVVMHCLPAYRGLEITEEVLEGPRSIVWQQSGNKMYGAAGILDFILS